MNETITNGQRFDTPINVYHIKDDSETVGWIFLSFSLCLVIIILITFLLLAILKQSNIPPCNCYGPYGVQIGVDTSEINQCGTSRNEPCLFRKNSLADCVSECETLSNICQAFTFNQTNLTMKIVQPTNTFQSPFTNLFVRQSGII